MNKQHEKKIKELIKTYSITLLDDCLKMYNSGMIDTESYNQDEYVLAKILVTAAIERTKDAYRPLHDDHRAELKNLMHV